MGSGAALQALMGERILVLDGAWGTRTDRILCDDTSGSGQLHDYATRKNTTPDEMGRWLRPHL